MNRRGLMLVVSSPSGAGKTTLSRGLLGAEREIVMSVSLTTRPPRRGEVEGKDYHFVDEVAFNLMVNRRELLEHAKVFDHYYGTPAKPVFDALKQGRDVLFDIDWQGTQQLREKGRDDLVSVFVLPPSIPDLEARLRTRAQDADDVIHARMSKASDEMSHWAEYDYVVINRDVRRAFEDVCAILAAERLKRERQTGLSAFVRSLQAAFAENWRDSTGMLLGGDAYFPPPQRRGDLVIQPVKSSPASGAAEAYVLFQLAIDSARSSIYLTNPYFVPDGAMTDALVRAAQRGVDVSIITAGPVSSVLDRLVRKASQAHFGRALAGGVKIYEYGPAFLHAKTMVVDGQWVSIGSANIDNRSFALNNELNLTFLDAGLAARLTRVFKQDLAFTTPVTHDEWQRHGVRNLFYLPLMPLRDQL